MGWNDKTVIQKVADVVKYVALASILACTIFNCVAIYKATDETWFVRCEDCKGGGGDVKCERCCKDCTWKDEAFFYIFRGYTLIFCIVAFAAEFKSELFEEYIKVCHFFVPRGFWQIFIGLSTVQANVLQVDDDGEKWADVIGWILVGIGILHMILGCLCFKEYSKDSRDTQMTGVGDVARANPSAGPSQI